MRPSVRRAAVAAAGIAAAAGLTVGLSIPAHAVVASGYCADIPYDSKTPGTIIQIWSCNGKEQQNWEWLNTYGAGWNYIQVRNHNGMCLDDKGTNATPGTPVISYPCNNADQAQLWYIGHNKDGTVYMQNDWNNAVVTVWGGLGNGHILVMGNPEDSITQRFYDPPSARYGGYWGNLIPQGGGIPATSGGGGSTSSDAPTPPPPPVSTDTPDPTGSS